MKLLNARPQFRWLYDSMMVMTELEVHEELPTSIYEQPGMDFIQTQNQMKSTCINFKHI